MPITEATRTKRLHFTYDELYKLYWEEGLTLRQLAKKFDCCQRAILVHMRKLQIPCRHGTPEKYNYPSREELYHLYWEDKLTIQEIADKLGIGDEGVRHKLKREGILRRDRNIWLPARVEKFRAGHARRKLRFYKEILANTQTKEFLLAPDYIVGLTDGEGSFSIGLDFRLNPPSAYLSFSIDNTNKPILEMIKKFFGFGSLSPGCQGGNKTCYKYSVGGIKNQLRIAQFFLEHPLFIKAHAFRCWFQALQLIIKNEHRTEQGFRQVVLLKEVINAH